MRLRVNQYSQDIKLKVPPLYPEEGVLIEFGASNFPTDMQYMFRCQAEEVVRRCVAGCVAEEALSGTGPVDLSVPAKGKDIKPTAKMTTGTIQVGASYLILEFNLSTQL
jgi:hypothetical protein